MSFAQKFFNWLNKSSVKNAADPDPKTSPYVPDINNVQGQVTPVEYNTEQEVIIGSGINLGRQDVALQGPNGEFYFSSKSLSILCGCGHLVSQLHEETEPGKTPKRGICGKCLYCEVKFEKMVSKKLMTREEADIKSSVCTECARITTSGILCCPKHYTEVVDSDGKSLYLSPETVEVQNREEIISKIFSPFVSLFTEQNSHQLPSPEDNNE